MSRARSVGAQGLTVGRGAVSSMPGKSVLRIASVQGKHESVAVGFGNNRGRGNGVDIPISFFESGLGYGIVRQQAAIYQHMFGSNREVIKGRTHGFQAGLINIDPINLPDLNQPDANAGCNLTDFSLKTFPHPVGQGLGIAHPRREGFRQSWRKNHCRSHHRTGEGSHANLVYAGNNVQPGAPQVLLNNQLRIYQAGSHRVFYRASDVCGAACLRAQTANMGSEPG